jgi:hypothetical protein
MSWQQRCNEEGGGREGVGVVVAPDSRVKWATNFGFKMTIFNERFDFMHSTYFKLLNTSTFNKRHFL